MAYIVHWPNGWHTRYRVDGVEVNASSPLAAAEIFAEDVTTEYWDVNYGFHEDCGDDLIVSMKSIPHVKWRINVSKLGEGTCLNTLALED